MMISLVQLNAASDTIFLNALGGIYEHSEWIARAILPQRPFSSLDDLRNALRQVVESSAMEKKRVLIRAHPDLAGRLARAGKLTEESTREQAGLGLDRLSDEEYETFSECNRRYRESFGFPFIICARMTTKDEVLAAFKRRLENSANSEVDEAIEQIHHIARLRLLDIITG
jgi:2-oxo-4-hydroxy-4-carboxy-5-ureidoimidazoline decarboxylase